ncbi:helix-turn-helix transcriptional regulator [Streptomyces sp. NPDC006415]|uniref:helix-turn-helix transcriptional regulator n=1 Tax=Streptomyces sp. NPDC006415 TaxID=3155351 RepID=UPI0033AE5ACA
MELPERIGAVEPSGDTSQAVYRFALRQTAVTAADVAAALALDVGAAEDHCAQLADLGLLAEDTRASPTVFRAVDPETAGERVLGPLERVIRTRRQHLEEVRTRLLEFSQVYEEQPVRTDSRGTVEFLASLSSTRAAIVELAAKCESEVLTAQPGGGRRAEVLEEAISRDEAMLRSGVRMRTLYQHTARFSPGTREYVDRVSRMGAEVRTLDDQFIRVLLFDRRAAVIGVESDPGSAIIVREPNLIHFIAKTFDLWWLNAAPFPLEWSNQEVADIADQLKQRIALLLSEGLTDQTIAKRMGMSVRTCRRHIAEIMERLGAKSRFQAGFLLSARTDVFTAPEEPGAPEDR